MILKELDKASLHDLYHIRRLIDHLMDKPQKIQEVKRGLYMGKEIEYYDDAEDRLIRAKILQIKRTRVLVRDLDGGHKWALPLYLIKMDKTFRVLISGFLLFFGVVLFFIIFISGFLLQDSNSNSPSSNSDFPIIIFVPIFFGIIIPLMATIRKRR